MISPSVSINESSVARWGVVSRACALLVKEATFGQRF